MGVDFAKAALTPGHAVVALSLSLVVASASGQTITIARSGSQPSRPGPAENFTGSVRVDPWFQATAPKGDVVWIPPNQKHWHGAAPNSSMAHIAIVEQLDGKSADWMEKVSEEQYNMPVRGCESPTVPNVSQEGGQEDPQ